MGNSIIVMGVVAAILLAVGYFRGEQMAGMKAAWGVAVNTLPLIVLAFVIAGMIKVLLPEQLVVSWIGAGSGLRGILIATLAGVLVPAEGMLSLSVAGGLAVAGAGIGPIVAYLTAFGLFVFNRLPVEIGILGWRLMLIRVACTFFLPPLAGLIAQAVFKTPLIV